MMKMNDMKRRLRDAMKGWRLLIEWDRKSAKLTLYYNNRDLLTSLIWNSTVCHSIMMINDIKEQKTKDYRYKHAYIHTYLHTYSFILSAVIKKKKRQRKKKNEDMQLTLRILSK